MKIEQVEEIRTFRTKDQGGGEIIRRNYDVKIRGISNGKSGLEKTLQRYEKLMEGKLWMESAVDRLGCN